jgi:hypothetical protein
MGSLSRGVSAEVSNVYRSVRGTESAEILNDQCQEGAANSVTSQKEKHGKKKKKKKSKKTRSMQLSPLCFPNVHQGPVLCSCMPPIPHSQNSTVRKGSNANYRKETRM